MVASARIACCGMLLFVSNRLWCQAVGGSPRPPELETDTARTPGYASVGFNKLLNTYQWSGNAVSIIESGPLSFTFLERARSTVIRTGRNLIKDEQSADLLLKHRWTGSLRGVARLSSFILSDNRNIGISNTSSHILYGGVEYEPVRRIFLEPLIGLRQDDQFEQRDRGLSYLLGISADSLDYYGYQTEVDGRFQQDRLNPRTHETHALSATISKDFLDRTRNVLRFSYQRNRRDFYIAADTIIQSRFNVVNNIESRAEDAFAVSDSLAYSLNRNMFLNFQGNIFTRDIGRETKYRVFLPGQRSVVNTDIAELRIDGSAQVNYAEGRDFNGSLSFMYQERDERHTVRQEDEIHPLEMDSLTRFEERKDNHSRRTALATNLSVALSRSHMVSLSASSSLLRYDTPSSGNDDDRDELWTVFGLTTFHRINTHLDLSVAADISLMHLVYILSTRSADNTWNRILRLSPRVAYSPSSDFSTTNSFEVLANYTVYDFEYPSSPVRSFAFRQFAFIDSTTLALSNRLSLEWFSHVRLYERGELHWSEFSERPLNSFEDKTCIGQLRCRLRENLLFSIGIRYFSQTRFGYSGSERTVESFLRSVGPITNILLGVGERTVLTVNGWYENQTQTGFPDRGFANMSMSLNVRI